MKLAFRKIGKGFPVVILHGLYGSGDNWFSIARILSEKYEVFLPDQRNHGQSEHSEDINYSILTRDLEEFFDEQHIREAYLVGHSMGGKVAMEFALKNPEKVKKLIVVDIALRSYLGDDDYALQAHFHKKIIKILLSVDIHKATSRTEIDSYLATFITESQVRQFLLKNLKRKNDGSFYWGLNLLSLDNNIHRLLEAVNTQNTTFCNPFLLLSGRKSGYIKPNDIEDIKRIFTSFSHVELNCGHWVHVEQAELFMQNLQKFLEDK